MTGMSNSTAALWVLAAVVAFIAPTERGAFVILIGIALFFSAIDLIDWGLDIVNRRHTARMVAEVEARRGDR